MPKAESSPKFEEHLLVKTELTPPSSAKLESTPLASAKLATSGPQLIGHLPRAEEDALRTFTEITQNRYQYSTLGRSREAGESMTCECSFTPGVDSPWDACGDDCINRLTQVECLPEDCRCRYHCQNQRFQRREYAPIEIVLTEKKGFGLRAAQNIKKDAFIYEYVGDVVSNPSFVKRMRDYAEEGIRHFYFMMLQKDEFIDATKRGGIGRFANHSCNPNCYVAKWTVGEHVRMGIFANRNIVQHEELTFNYNVDRYGHDAQPCYCGEAKCVGFIGGKTQTDLAAMDDLYLDALGISDEVDRLGLKGSKKKKGKKLDEDWVPILKPLIEKDVPKVVQAMRQTSSRKVMVKLLMRLKMTEDQSALRQMMRLRGFSLMTNVMGDYLKDDGDDAEAIQCMAIWPLISRNKVEDSKVYEPVKKCTESTNGALKEAAEKLLANWDNLETAYRIPKRLKTVQEDAQTTPTLNSPADPEPRLPKRSKLDDLAEVTLNIKPLGFTTYVRPIRPTNSFAERPPEHRDSMPTKRPAWQVAEDTARIIAEAAAAEQAERERAQATAVAAAEAAEAEAAKKADREKRRADRKEREKGRDKEMRRKDREKDREANKEKRLMKLIGAVVVKAMSKYKSRFGVDDFKRHAKELTHIIAEKEKKSSSYRESKLDALSDEKQAKIKKFAREYIHKVLHKMEKHRKRPPESSASTTSSRHAQANASGSASYEPEEDADGGMAMTVEEAMDMSDDEPEPEHEDDEDRDDEIREADAVEERSPSDTSRSVSAVVADPRLRARAEKDKELGWDPHRVNGNGYGEQVNGLGLGMEPMDVAS
ncbi:hypothetical protein FA95DRAFT_1483622 [Auriscalpium vulgare]|uniref:Uncharacterized protein n=1 Tax=Auriscalpium vulgare TaxID=40419 RepID=A0ACB8S920_9AGAM|nr:hypothetical protein FA95DRAFT_1483622 [Auriscalpium vulgare]